MAIKFVSRFPGTGVVLGSSSWSATRDSTGATIRPSSGHLTDWVYFPIPTAYMMDGDNIKATYSQIRFQTGDGATVKGVRVRDGDNIILDATGLAVRHPAIQTLDRDIPNDPQVRDSLVVALYVQFSGTGTNDYIRLSWAGVYLDNI